MRKIVAAFLGFFIITSINAQGIRNTVDSNNVFAFKLFNIIKNGHNLFYSPFSISSAMAMTYAGAKGETEMQMSRVLCFNTNLDSVNKSFEKLIKTNAGDTTKGFQLYTANSLWAQKSYTFLDSYFDVVKTYYHSIVNRVDFKNENEKTRTEINKWVEERTANKIQNLLPKGSLKGPIEIALVNTIYFHGSWEKPFNIKATAKDVFYLKAKDTVRTSFMNLTDHFNYYEDGKFHIVELPYKDNKASMIIFLPDRMGNIRDIENAFTYHYYKSIVDSMKPERVAINLPKFKTTKSFSLGDTLSEMGMPLAFSGKADFSGMTGKQDISLSKVLHKAFVSVTEDGTEAAAATVVTGRVTGVRPGPVKNFKANHPFFYIIRDNVTGSILFMGEVINPTRDN